MGIKLMVSIWPTVDEESENREAMEEAGMLIRSERNTRYRQLGDAAIIDVTNPETRKFVWNRIKENYYDKGIKIFWLDEAEPEYTVYDFENYRYHLGPNVQVGNVYPVMYAQAFFDGMKERGSGEYREPSALRMGRQPEVWRTRMVRRHSFHI